MKAYIASSWRNAAGVEMLTQCLRLQGWEVSSWVENNFGETHNHVTKKFDFEDWVRSSESDQSFEFDTNGAMECDLFIYYAPAGMDACAELGACYASRALYNGPDELRTAIVGLRGKGDGLGLMRKMVDIWFDRASEVVKFSRDLIDPPTYPG